MFRFALPLILAVSSTALFACPDHKKEYDGKLKADTVKAHR